MGETIEVQARRLTIRGVLDKLGTQDDGTVFMPILVVGLHLLAGVYPAWRSAGVSPMTSMRGAI